MDQVNAKPLADWTLAELEEKRLLVEEARENFGIQAARDMMAKLGFPIPPPELCDPVEVIEQRSKGTRH